MASNIRIERTCLFCSQLFVAKTTVTKYCSHKCSQRHYKKRKRDEKLMKASSSKVIPPIQEHSTNLFETITKKDFLSIKESAVLIGVSESTFYRLMRNKTIKSHKLGGRTIIKRSDIGNLFT